MNDDPAGANEAFRTSKDEIQGTSECPVCGKDSPHQHAVDAIRWYGDHFPRFMLAINKGEPKEKFDWGGLYPDPVERDAPPRFRNEWYQSRWESYCWCVLIGLIPARPPFEAEPILPKPI